MAECYINRLPIELLAMILEEHSALELRAPFIDSQVCRQWHETTRLWPRVWSYITMRSITEQNIPINPFKAILERSGDSPLHVNLDYPDFFMMWGVSAMLLFQRPTISRIRILLLRGVCRSISERCQTSAFYSSRIAAGEELSTSSLARSAFLSSMSLCFTTHRSFLLWHWDHPYYYGQFHSTI